MNDWEIVELNAQYLEDQLLNQIAVLRQGLVLPIWIKQRIKVLFKVGMFSHLIPFSSTYSSLVSMIPDNVEFATIGPGTEVAISPKQRDKNTLTKQDDLVRYRSYDCFRAHFVACDQ